MNAENQLLQPTGQATPNTQNAQVAPGLNITQTGDQLQYTDQSLFSGVSNKQIVVLKQNGTVAAATTTPDSSLAQQSSDSSLVFILSFLLLFTVVALIIIKIKSKNQDSNVENG